MKRTTREGIRELRRILGQMQSVVAVTAGASKDTVAGWETGRNRLSAGTDPDMARMMGFRDDPAKGGQEMLRLEMETVPLWMPGYSMRKPRRNRPGDKAGS